MKAVVAYPNGTIAENPNFPEPVAQHRDEVLVTVKAVAVKHFDKSRAAGQHYSSEDASEAGRIIGGDGVCLLPDGRRVYALGETGMMAEKAIIDRDRIVPIPDGVDDALAAALPNAVVGAAMGLKFKADIQKGDIVLINGATGFTGRVAVQIAKYLGAKRVIVTGRNQESLNDLLLLGADEIIPVTKDDESFKKQLSAIHAQTPIDIIIDYLWGHSAELLFACIKGKGHFNNKIRFVSVGSMAGDTIQLSSAILRSIDLQLTGSGLGAWTKSQVGEFFSDIMPEAFQLAAKGKLKADTITVPMSNLASLWEVEVPSGQRLVVTI
ncbi:alcohol dehydrogenase [Niastella koreensis]|uniref:Alcohol dehydrogenase zinc-binding domain protein n=2 Tax=Niastella koreensis TaxID=354356 RepID=G8TK62_NIAKG|nr:zinc-binding dehydrogenase [Niastella koreensis]AEV96496.1 Alcohol dehydrogenase zinc-binding domain protein [Niastella koreensis GR20-10]OQP54017.1 alcohol dehydrogenase [Niastella koreensis]